MKFIGQQTSLLRLAAAFIATSVWSVGTALACTPSPSNPDDPNDKLACGENSALVYAYAATGVTGNADIYKVASGGLQWYDGGYGITNSVGGETYYHSIDNYGYTDMLALNFVDGPVALDSVTLGWSSGDADFSLLAWGGNGTPTIAGQKVASLNSSWTWVGNYNNAAAGSSDVVVSVNSQNVSSSWWIISAYNQGFANSQSLDGATDSFKVLAVACKEPGHDVPEPGSMMLLGAGLFGIMAVRRRRQAAN